MENAKKPEQKSTLKLLKEQRGTIQQLLVSHLDIGQRSYYDFETTQVLQEILKTNNQIFKNLGYEN